MNGSAKARLYAALGRAFDEPHPNLLVRTTENPLLAALGEAINAGGSDLFSGPFNRLWEALDKLVEDHGSRAVEELQIEHTRLFFGPPCPLVQPYEHAYRKGRTPAAATTELAATYRRFGIEVSPEFHDLVDHVCLELEFLAHLLDRGREAEADRFRRDHLAGFLPRFAAAVRMLTSSPFYDAAAQALDALAIMDCSACAVGLEKESHEAFG